MRGQAAGHAEPRFEQKSRGLGSARVEVASRVPRVELLHVLMPDFERADRIGEFWGYPESRTFEELLIDCEEDRTLRAVRRHASGERPTS